MTERLRVRRQPKRASYDAAEIAAVLDEALVCHLGFIDGGQPVVIPTTFARVGDQLYVHSARVGRLARAIAGAPVCVEVTLLDGLVLARSAFHHSMNYRSVMAFGDARLVEGDEKDRALQAMVEKVSPGRSDEIRGPNPRELKATAVCALALDEAVLKRRAGPPIDDPEDMSLPCWAGVIPLALARGEPVPDA